MNIFILTTILSLSIIKPFTQKQLLMDGVWVSADDKKSTLVFTNNSMIWVYGKDTTNIVRYCLADSCTVDTAAFTTFGLNKFDTPHEYDYIVTDDEFCYAINGIMKDILSMQYQGRGNLLLFKKMKKRK